MSSMIVYPHYNGDGPPHPRSALSGTIPHYELPSGLGTIRLDNREDRLILVTTIENYFE